MINLNIMRTFTLLIFLTFCSYALAGQNLRERMQTAIDMGTYSAPFTYTNSVDLKDYPNDYSCQANSYDDPENPPNDVFYKLTLRSSMELYFKNMGSGFDNAHLHTLDASGKELRHDHLYSSDIYGLYMVLAPGTYYFVIEPSLYKPKPPLDLHLVITLEGRARTAGEDFFYPINLGTYDSPFTISHTLPYGIYRYDLDYNMTGDFEIDCVRHDVVYQFTITKTMNIKMSNCGTKFRPGEDYYRTTLMSSPTDSIREYYSQNACPGLSEYYYELPPGTYYLYTFADLTYTYNTNVLNLEGKSLLPGANYQHAINVGSYNSDFAYTDTRDTNLFIRSLLSNKDGNEVFYKLTLTTPMELTINNCGSVVNDTYLMICSADEQVLYYNDNYSGPDGCGNPANASLCIPVIMPGTYYIVTDGSTNGNVTTNIQGLSLGAPGDKQITAINAGNHEGGFSFTDTRDTSSGYTNQFNGKPSNDVFYKLTLTKPMDVKVSHCGSVVADTYLSILNASGTVIYSNDNYIGEEQCGSTGNALIKVNDLPAGTYYIVSEGNSENGMITTNIEALGELGPLSPTMGQPHVISFIPTVATDNILSLKGNEVRHEIQYYDYYGNPTVKVQHGFSPYGKDISTLQEYDGLGRESNLWLPVAKDNADGAYTNPGTLRNAAKAFFLYGNDTSPYNRTVYDKSALNEVIEQYGPGVAWHNTNKSVKTSRMTNQNQENSVYSNVLLFQSLTNSTGQNILINQGTYGSEELHVTKTTDEDGHTSYEFKDKSGRVILNRQINDNQMYDTYMVYDNYGNVRYVLPPMAADSLNTSTNWNEENDILKRYAYVYRYDEHNRQIYKKLPGCDPVYIVYDAADRPIFTQDGNLRDKNEWLFSIPDAFNRTVLTGICKNTLDYMSNPLDSIVAKAHWFNEENTLKGYRITGITLNNPTVLSANYFDNYQFLGKNGIPSDERTTYVEMTEYGKRFAGGCKGQQTGSWTICHPSEQNGFFYSVMYYDDRYKVIQQRGNNGLNGVESIYTAYNFEGSPLKEKHVHSASGKDGVTEEHLHTYDLANRLVKTTYQLNNDNPIVLIANVYDEIGRLMTDKRNGNPLLKTDYSYNLRSWTKSIKGILFNQTLNYQETERGNIPCYNGNISSMTWQTAQNGTDNVKGYRFTYDDLSQLKNAIYGEGTDLSINQNRFNEQVTSYDKMGNILNLLRCGQTSQTDYSLIDNLNLTYNGNQLQSVYDNVTNSIFGNGMEFKNNSNQTVEYKYDKNGNLTKDLNKNITDIQYNFLNLPSRVVFVDGNSIEYLYDGKGTKVRTVHHINGKTDITDYCGNAIYENGELKMLLNEAGYYNAQERKLYFYLKDHQGNVRVVADKYGNVKETNDYYPFGGLMSSSSAEGHPYKYNGKELDRKGGLDWYDYGARQYDATIGRWHAVDPLCEKYYSISPYVYCANNPVKYIDPDGRDWRIQTSFNQETGKIEYNMTVNAVLYNNSSNSSFDMKKLAKSITQQVEDVYNISRGDFVSTMKFNMRVANSVDDIKETDHVFRVVDQVELDNTYSGRAMPGQVPADSHGFDVRISSQAIGDIISGKDTRTMAHELGHTGGLHDLNRNVKENRDRLMMQANNVYGNPNEAVRFPLNDIKTIRDNYIHNRFKYSSPIVKWFGKKFISRQ